MHDTIVCVLSKRPFVERGDAWKLAWKCVDVSSNHFLSKLIARNLKFMNI